MSPKNVPTPGRRPATPASESPGRTPFAIVLSLAVSLTVSLTVSLAVSLTVSLAVSPLAGQAMQKPPLPASDEETTARLEASSRHGEWVQVDAGGGDQVKAWLVYPERSDPAPVVVVIHEIFGLADWVRAVADQLAADGFIAIAPDLLSGKGPNGGGSESLGADGARGLIPQLDRDEIVRRLDAAAHYAMNLPAARKRYGVIGFCWGGSTSFFYATRQPELGGAVVYYGSSPEVSQLAAVRAPVLGLYGGDDARVNATIPPAEGELKRLGRRFEYHIYEGAGHGFLRAQGGREGANLRASEQAWPATLAFLRRELGR
ncbi:MAG: dienelactone hydrolase family protein [Gemmatimonadetes bacterium]|nr:dienelactone hydrolase family protein [Gemmatimonadota bacterium]